jgi:F-type H+-transporting ATPase subunit delta
MTGAAVAYGGSLYELAVEEAIDRRLLDELTDVSSLFSENPEYVRLLAEPSIPKKERCALIDESLGGKVHPYVTNFLKILCENGILSEFSGCVREYRRRLYEANGILTATAVSAVALTSEQADRLREKLVSLTGHTVELTVKTDPTCIGGLRLDIDGKRLDGTVRERLDAIRTVLSAGN